jgi:hypothetical protein
MTSRLKHAFMLGAGLGYVVAELGLYLIQAIVTGARRG